MPEYIKAVDAADKFSEISRIPLCELVDIMVGIPAADVETVRHGQWIAMHYEGGILDGTDVDKCSKCGAERVIEEPKYKTKYNYCPNCGAKMNMEDK